MVLHLSQYFVVLAVFNQHNNFTPYIHCKKKYLQSSRGPLKVRLLLNQVGKKQSRRVARAAKRAAQAPTPLEKLRPVVH
jgi:large subunit ribosomal protein L13e